MLRHVHAHPGVTRADLARDLGLSRGSASELTARLAARTLIAGTDAAPTGLRGRPTHAFGPHPEGPVVAAVSLAHDTWRLALVAVGGEIDLLRTERLPRRRDPGVVLEQIRTALAEANSPRLQAVGVSVPGIVNGGVLIQASTLGWAEVEVARQIRGLLTVPVLVGNDATLAGVAEARRGAARDVDLTLHLTVEVGIGGVLLDHGRPLAGSSGAGGEFGHMPFGDPRRHCPCGARGCWDLEADARALARLSGARSSPDPRTTADAVLARAAAGDPAAGAAVQHVATALGRGIAGLVNAMDPRLVTLSGLAPAILDLAGRQVEEAYVAGLMGFRRSSPPPLTPSWHPLEGTLRGAAELGFDAVLSHAGLDRWSAT